MMRPMLKLAALMLVMAPLCAIAQEKSAEPAQKDLGLFAKDASWKYSVGRPGGQGSFELGADGDKAIGTMKYDFSSGKGDYVQAVTSIDIKEGLGLTLKARTETKHRVTIRLTDDSGQTLQYKFPVKAGEWQTINIVFAKKAEHWGGANDGKVHLPIRTFSLSVPKPAEAPLTGKVDFADAALVTAVK